MGGFGILGGDALVASYVAKSLHDAVTRDTEFLECFRVVGRREEKVLDGDKVVLNSFGLVLALGEKLVRDVNLVRCAGGTVDPRLESG